MSAMDQKQESIQSLDKNADYSGFRKMDLPLLIISLILCTFGLVMMFSSSISISFARTGDSSSALISKQIGITGGALLASIFMARFIRLNFFRKRWFRNALYIAVTVFLMLVLIRGQTINGAKRWLDLKIFTFQPSEAAKIGAVLWLSLELEYQKQQMQKLKNKWRDPWQKFWQQGRYLLTWPACKMVVWFGLIIVQPHFSAALIFAIIVCAMFLFAGLQRSVWISGSLQLVAILLILGLLLLIMLPWFTGMSNSDFLSRRFAHVFRRLDTYQDPVNASDDDIMQIRQAQIALGSGGLTGVGLGRSVQKMNWLPEAHNDYVLAIIGEELGFLGTAFILLLFVAFMFRGFSVALTARSRAGLMIAAGYTFFLVLQALINFGVAVNLLPATGISLPFFSSGGTANAFFIFAAGMILLVSKWDQKENPELSHILVRERRGQQQSVAPNLIQREAGTGS
jgi:cell division protein FtsW